MKYYPMQMHLHTCHQPGGSMEGHIYNAKRLGMEYIRFTDHDTRIGPKNHPLSRFDFSKGELSYKEVGGRLGFQTVGDGNAFCEDNSIRYTFAPEGGERREGGLYYFSDGNSHTVSLIGDITLCLDVSFRLYGDARAVIDIRLSQRPPDHSAAHFRYVLGAPGECSEPHTVEYKLPEPVDGVYRLHLSEDIGKCRELGGLDNVFDTATILIEANDGGGEFVLREFEIKRKYGYDELIKRQRIVADEIGARYGVKPFVTTEISGAGQHKNVFSTAVPVIDYAERGFQITEMEAIAHVKRHGGIFAYNHPFENNKYKKLTLTDEEIKRAVEDDAASLIASRALGASMMEVAFIEGRGQFGLREYLRLWDLMGLGGVFITGYGDSDSHKNHLSWFEGQNACSWIAADENIPFPIAEEHFIASMKAGRVYAGDPVYLTYPISFFSGSTEMGGIIPVPDGDYDERRFTFTASAPEPGSEIRAVVDGMTVISEIVEGGEYRLEFSVKPERCVSLARIELYNPRGRCILITNPIYLVRTAEYPLELPGERLYGEFRK